MSTPTVKVNLPETALQARIREKLNQEGVKLWEKPFYDETTKTPVDSEVIAISSRYATELNLVESDAVDIIFGLQRHALQRVTELNLFKETGLATLRVKFSGFSTEAVEAGSIQRVELDLSSNTGKNLKEMVAQLVAVAANRLKLICSGRVVNETDMLDKQNIKNGSQVMVLSIATDQDSFQKTENQLRELEETKGAADFLSGKDLTAEFSLQVADQSGKALNLPDAEKKALATAIALHEKGRSAMKNSEFSKALVFLLESDAVYSQCNSGLLDMVDNYGLLNLDIAWCYLNLQSIADLPAVDIRLSKCEKSLQKSYGENMERVIALKGSSGWEAALFVRLHLLQAIACYHQGRIEKSKFYISKVESEMNRLQVSDEKLAEMINMGYEAEESRLALRSTFGDIPAAVDWIIRRRAEKTDIRRQEEEDLVRRKLQKQVGTCDNGTPVNVTTWRQMREMGFQPLLAAEALKRANNDLSLALQFAGDQVFIGEVQSKMQQKALAASARAQASSSNAPAPSTSGTVQETNRTGSSEAVPAAEGQQQNSPLLDLPETLSDESIDSSPAEDRERSQKAFEALSKDTCSESEYIDLALSAESGFLNQYKNLLNM